MPYTKKPALPWTPMQRLLRSYGLTATLLADILRVSRPTAAKRLSAPGALTLEELHTISQRAHIPIEEIREAMQR